MSDSRRPSRLFWTLGLAVLGVTVLLATAVGARVLAVSGSGDAASHGKEDRSAAVDEVVALGFADVEPGVAGLNPVQGARVLELPRENQSYTAGQILVRLDDQEARLRVLEAQRELDLAKEEWSQAKTKPEEDLSDKIELQKLAIESARRQLATTQASAKVRETERRGGVITRAMAEPAARVVEQTRAQLQLEEKRLALLEKQRRHVKDKERLAAQVVKAKEAKVKRAETALEDYVIKAPEDGKVLRVLVRKGEMVGPARSSPAVQFCPTKPPRIIRAELEQEYAALVNPGAAVTVVDDSSTGERWTGRVVSLSDWYTRRRAILQEPKIFNDVRTLECIVSLKLDGKNPPRIGQRVRVLIKTTSKGH